MPLYALKCVPCDHRWEDFARITDDHSRLKCPACGKRQSEIVPSRTVDADRRFSGDECLTRVYGCSPQEVKHLKRLMPAHQHCISDSGDVSFSSRSEARGFERRRQEVSRMVGEGRFDELGVSRKVLT